MLPYIILFSFVAILLVANHYDSRFSSFVFSVIFLFLVIFSGTRIGLGRDYSIYEQAFLFPEGKTALFFEPIWQWINHIFHVANLDFHSWLIFTAFFTILMMFVGMRKMSKDIAFSIILFLLLFRGYFETMNMVRQYFAMAIVFVSFPLFLSKKYFLFFLSVGFAALFHSSALCMLIIPLFLLRKINNYFLMAILVFTRFFGSMILVPIMEYASFLLPARYSFYIEREFVAAVSSSGFYSIFLNLTAIFFLFLMPKIQNRDTTLNKYVILYVISIIIYNLTISFEVAMRFMFYPFIFIFILIPNAYKSLDNIWSKRVIWTIILAFTLFTLKDLSNPMEPYSSYQTVLYP